MKARIILEVSYDQATCSCLKTSEVGEALEQEVRRFISQGGLTPTIVLAADCNLVVDEHTVKVEVTK